MSFESDALSKRVGKNQYNSVYQILILVRYHKIEMTSISIFHFFTKIKKTLKRTGREILEKSIVARPQAVRSKSKPMKIQICKDQCIHYPLLHSKLPWVDIKSLSMEPMNVTLCDFFFQM